MKYLVFSGLVFIGFLSLNFSTTKIQLQQNCTECHSDLMEYKNMHAVMEMGCETCHESTGEGHPNTGGFKLTEAIPALCYMCHDEYSKKNIHYPAGEGECLACHAPHGSEFSSILNVEAGKICAECHDAGVPENNVGHYPYSEGECSSCHDSHQSDNGSLLKSAMPALCFECHENTSEGASSIHAVFEECSTCHSSHSAEQAKLLIQEMPGLCFNCHEEFSKNNIHSPVAEGECAGCHNPHAAQNSSLLNVATEELCASCHDASVPEGHTVHYPFTEGSCSDCHEVHESDNPALVKTAQPGMCYECHENTSEGASSVHAILDECSTCHSPHSSEQAKLLTQETPGLCLNCHEESSGEFAHAPVKNGECASCHNPHASEQSSLLTANKQELCLGCHSKTYRTDSTLVENIGQKITKSQYIHAAIEMDGCSTCHSAHSTGRSAMLKNNFPASYYVRAKPENFALCFDCHDGAILQEDASASGTNFRNGSQNLHYFHINGTRGRSCSMCHDVHASINEHLIRDVVPFGKWEMQMNYKPMENGGSCMPGCHGELKYDRVLVE